MSDKNDLIDLGSEDPEEEFDPFLDEDLDDAEEIEAETPADELEQPQAKPKTQPFAPKQSKAKAASKAAEKSDNPLESAINAAETKEAEKAQQSLYEKPPVFEYAGASEDIEDSSQTFEELRIAKAADFPELDDGKRVSWTVEYGKITKPVADAKGTSIAKMKSDIETSKEFLDALKKSKDKNPACKIKPRVTAQSKGMAKASGYKGVFTCMTDVTEAGKTISILPSKDGKVYEIRLTDMGIFTTPTSGDNLLSDVRAGFTRLLPLIPKELLMQIIAFFRHFTREYVIKEALINIYWDKLSRVFVVDSPEQFVTRASVNSRISDEFSNERYLHYMDIHSHNSMRAFFSPTDDNDEKATRLYTVIGCLNKFVPEIKTRISNGGKFHEVDPGEVFEQFDGAFPVEWKETVQFRNPHDDDETALADSLPYMDISELDFLRRGLHG